jgi:hypothetical protein
MGIDMSRMAAAAIEAALDDGKPHRRRLSGMRAVATGAALAVAARVAVSKAPGHVRVPHLSAVPDLVRDRLADRGWLPEDAEDDFDDEEFDDEEPQAEGDEDFDDEDLGDDEPEDDEPQAEAEDDEPEDDEPQDEPEDEEPQGKGDDEQPDDERPDDDGEPRRSPAPGVALTADGDGRQARGSAPDIIGMLGAHRSRPPVMSRARTRARRRIDPAAKPPEPPEREAEESKRSNRRKKATTKAGGK